MFCRRLRRVWNTNRNQSFQFLYLLLLLQCKVSESQRNRHSDSGSTDRYGSLAAGSKDHDIKHSDGSRDRYINLETGSSDYHASLDDGSKDRFRNIGAGSKDRYMNSSANLKNRSVSPSAGLKDFGNGTVKKCFSCHHSTGPEKGDKRRNEGKDGVGQIRLFKYLQPDEVTPEPDKPSEEVSTDRSLIPNSYFSTKPSASPVPQTSPLPPSTVSRDLMSPASPRPKHPLQEPTPTAPGVNGTIITASERPRRSPYHYPHRSPLYSRPPNAPSPYPPPSPSGFDFDSFPEYPEEPTFNHARYKRPPARRMPPQRRRHPGRPHKPRPAPRHRPMNLPHPHRSNRPVPIGIPAAPQYSYPKNAANIQDILNHFQTENEGPGGREPYPVPPHKHPAPQASSSSDMSGGSMGGSMGGDFSKELHDVQTSLLKDIREFARRPNMMSGEDQSHPPPAPTHTYPKRVPHDEMEEDDPFEPKPKPVRDLIRPKPVVRDREESRERHEQPKKSTRPREKENERWRDREREESEEKARSRHQERERERDISEEDEHRPRARNPLRERPRPRQKYASSSHSSKYKEADPGSGSYEDRDRDRAHRHREQPREREHVRHRDQTSDSSYHRSSPNVKQPVVLKRPYGPYRPEAESLEPLEMQRKNQYWNSAEESYRPPRPTLPRFKPTYRPEPPVEDIVEIHTDSPYRLDMERAAREREERDRVTRERERKAALHKLYLDYLEAEGVGTSPAPAVNKTPMRMKIHIYPNQKEPSEMGAEPSQSSYAAATPPRYNYPPSYINPPSYVNPAPGPGRGPYYSQGRTGPSAYNPSAGYSSGISGSGAGTSGMTGVNFGNSGSGLGTGTGTTSVGTAIDKNKNLVLHLHVHRRTGLEAMDAQASQIYTSTIKPLTYKEIYDEHLEQQEHHEDQSLSHRNSPHHHSNQNNHPNHNHHQHQPGEPEVDKSVSMELPIQDAKIEDVLHTLLKLRQ